MRTPLLPTVAALLLATPVAAQTAPTPRDSARHALDRLGYGPTPGLIDAVLREGVLPWVDRQLGYRDVADPALADRERGFAVLRTPSRDMVAMHTDQLAKALKAQAAGGDSAMRRDLAAARLREPEPGKRDLRELNGELMAVTLLRAAASERQLAEVMADFWTNHFNVHLAKGFDRAYFAGYLEATIRPHALGRFEELLIATAKSPAMLFYLDNAQSVADGTGDRARATLARRPAAAARRAAMDPRAAELLQQRMPKGLNENYARELLELHTLGVDGGYTQHDVTEVARLLTGWGIDRRGDHGFLFTAAAHDRGEKTVLGERFPAGQGEAEGVRLLRFLAAHPATLHHVSAKLCARFVADAPPDGCVDDAVRAWTRSGGEIREVLRAIVHSRDFWAPAAMQTKVKSPLEFVVSAVRAVGGTPDATPRLAQQVQRLGQPLFQRSTPDGWPETQADWVNSGALLARMTFAVALAGGRLPGVAVDLDRVVPVTTDRAALVERVDRALLGGTMSPRTRETILRELADVSDPRAARALAVGLALGGPEFQRQ